DHVVAVAQERDAVANPIIGVAADEAIVLGDNAADTAVAVGPGHRPAIAAPGGTSDHVVAVAHVRDAHGANLIIGLSADQAIVLGDTALDPALAVRQDPRPAIAVPGRTIDHVVAVAQGDDTADIIPRVASD